MAHFGEELDRQIVLLEEELNATDGLVDEIQDEIKALKETVSALADRLASAEAFIESLKGQQSGSPLE